MTDAELLEAVAARDQNAMTTLFDRYGRLVYSIALKVLRDQAHAEDVMQEVLLQVWRQPGGFVSQRGSLATWLIVVARNRSIDVIRRRSRLEPLENLVITEPRNLAQTIENSVLIQKVRTIAEGLSTDQQTTLEMAYFGGLSQSEIAEKTGTPLGTVKTRIRTALLSLRKALEA